VPVGADPAEAIRNWLAASRTTSARKLAEKVIVLIDPMPAGSSGLPSTPSEPVEAPEQSGTGGNPDVGFHG
jgi:hypothetical protein